MKNIPYKVFCKNLQDVQERFANCSIREITGRYNMLFLKDTEFAAVCEDGKFYLLTVKN